MHRINGKNPCKLAFHSFITTVMVCSSHFWSERWGVEFEKLDLTNWATRAPSLQVETNGQIGVKGCVQLVTWLHELGCTIFTVSLAEILLSQILWRPCKSGYSAAIFNWQSCSLGVVVQSIALAFDDMFPSNSMAMIMLSLLNKGFALESMTPAETQDPILKISHETVRFHKTALINLWSWQYLFHTDRLKPIFNSDFTELRLTGKELGFAAWAKSSKTLSGLAIAPSNQSSPYEGGPLTSPSSLHRKYN